MKYCMIIALIFYAGITTGICQDWELERSISISGINGLEFDNRGSLYLTLKGGEVRKLLANGSESAVFSPVKNGEIYSLEASQQFKVLLFYQNFQEVLILNRFLGDPARYDLEDFPIGYATHVAYNFQRNLWVIDQTDFSLKLCDVSTKELILNQSLYQFNETGYQDVFFMKEYQGRLYIADASKGILVFDNFGNLMKKINQVGIKDLSFDQSRVFCLLDDNIIVTDLYSNESESISVPKEGFNGLRNAGDRFFFIGPKGLEIYKYIRTN